MCDVCPSNDSVCRVTRGAQFKNVKSYCISCLLETFPKSAEVIA